MASKYSSIYDKLSKATVDYSTDDVSGKLEAQKAMLKSLVEKKVKAKRVYTKRTKPEPIVKTPTPEETISRLLKSCDGEPGDDAIATLKAAGWDVKINPAMAWDRKGYQITILEPKKEETNVQPSEGTKAT